MLKEKHTHYLNPVQKDIVPVRKAYKLQANIHRLLEYKNLKITKSPQIDGHTELFFYDEIIEIILDIKDSLDP